MGYMDKVTPKENLCLSYEQNADDVFESNNFVHSKEEAYWIRQAAQLRVELMNMTTGEEKLHQSRKVKELSNRLNEIAKTLDPEGYRKLMEKKKEEAERKAKNKANNGGGGSSSNPSSGRGDGVDEDNVKGWFAKKPEHGFDGVSGMTELKEKLTDCALSRKREKLKAFMKMPVVHTYFFYGPPGTGKTFICEAFAHELMEENYTYMYVSGAQIMSSLVGVAEKNIERLFKEAVEHAPCILFIDEIEGVCQNRSAVGIPTYAVTLTNSFLTSFNQFKKSKKPVIFIAATNFPGRVDNAMADRAELIYVPIPDAEALAAASKRNFDAFIQLEDEFTYDEIGTMLEGKEYNYRDLDRLVEYVKNEILKDLETTYHNEDVAIEAMQSGDYRLKKELFMRAFGSYTPVDKTDIKKSIEEWRKNLDEQ